MTGVPLLASATGAVVSERGKPSEKYKGGRGNLYILGAPYLVVFYLSAFLLTSVGHVVALPVRRNLGGFRKSGAKIARRFGHLTAMVKSSFDHR